MAYFPVLTSEEDGYKTKTEDPKTKTHHYPLFHGCLCKQSVKNSEQQIRLYNKKKIHARQLEDMNYSLMLTTTFYHSKIKLKFTWDHCNDLL